MNQARITLKLGVEIIAVEVPDEAIDFYPENGGITLWVYEGVDCVPIGIKATEVKKEDKTIGRFTELSEEQCVGLIGICITSSKGNIRSYLNKNGIDPNKALIIKVNQ